MTNLATRLNSRAAALCAATEQTAAELDVRVISRGRVVLLDFGSDRCGSLLAGKRLAEICLAGLGEVRFDAPRETGLPQVTVSTDWPLEACIAAQYAGWPFSHDGWFAMGSGPARMARGEEPLLIEYGLHEPAETVVGVLECDQLPDEAACSAFLEQCQAQRGYLGVARTASLPGSVQVVARSIETSMHKLHELGFDLRRIRSGWGTAPLPPIPADDLTALGWTNDAILYGAEVHLWVDAEQGDIAELGQKLPSCSSAAFGKPFLELFEEAGRDFYAIDPMLFSPAQITLQTLRDGRVSRFGKVCPAILRGSFGLDGESTS